MSRFLQALHSGRVLLMDGAMGTELIRAGLPPGEPCEAWNLTHPERVQAVHQAYVDAGAEVLLTNTFQANRKDSKGTIAQAATIARKAAGDGRFVLANSGPMGEYTLAALRGVVREILILGTSLATDGQLVETCSDERDLAWAAPPNGVVTPILISMTYLRSPKGKLRTHAGFSPETCARLVSKYPVSALGVNCGRDIGMDDVIEIVRRYRQVTDLPLFARPNAGTPKRDGDRWVYPLTPAEMAARLPELLEAGVCMVGGCCGTTPEHIAAMRPVVQEWNRRNA